MFSKTVATTISICLLWVQVAQGGIIRDTLRGGALGILQCQHIRSNKTKVNWRVIVNSSSKPINATHFRFETNSGVRDNYSTVVPPTVDYQTTEIFEGIQKQIAITGEAYNISLTGVHRYSLRKPLNVQCD